MAKVDPLSKVEEFGEEALNAVEHFGEGVVRGFQKLTRLHFPTRESAKPLKRSMTGYETEMFVLDRKGDVDQTGKLLELARKAQLLVTPEASKGMIEVLSLPHKHHRSASLRLLSNLHQLHDLAEKHNYALYPFGTYPGKQQPSISDKDWYKMLARVLGEDRFKRSAGLCCGYHQHYTLPRGLFDETQRTLKYTTSSKLKRTLLDSYNFLTAADPALTCFMQASPYIQGKFLAKDSRILMYRGGTALNFNEGKFARKDMHILGELSPYESTLHDMMHTIDTRRLKWRELMEEKRLDAKKWTQPKDALKFTWNPLKINTHGTLEYRGTDMNLISNTFAASTMIKFSLRRIQQDFALVTPLDIDMNDAFKLEGNFLFIPPHTQVRNELQHASVYEGLKNKELRIYMQRFFRFVSEEIKRYDPDYLPLLKPAQNMLDDGRTLADEMILRAKRKGYPKDLDQEYAREHALHYSDRFFRDLAVAERVLAKTAEYD